MQGGPDPAVGTVAGHQEDRDPSFIHEEVTPIKVRSRILGPKKWLCLTVPRGKVCE